MNEVEGYCAQLLKRDPHSFDGNRLTGDLDFARAGQAFKTARNDEGRKLLGEALEEYNKAEASKPGNEGVLTQIARTLTWSGDAAGAERVYRQVIEKNKTSLLAYSELYNLEMRQGKAADGESVLKLAFLNNPTQYVVLSRLALHYFGQNRRQDMLGVLDQIKAHVKDYERAYLDVGDFYFRLGDDDSAIREYREGIGAGCQEQDHLPEAHHRGAHQAEQSGRGGGPELGDFESQCRRRGRARAGGELPAGEGRGFESRRGVAERGGARSQQCRVAL